MLGEEGIRKLKKRFTACESESQVVRGVWNELEKYVVPYRGRMFIKGVGEGSVQWDKYDHYDDTAVISAQMLASSVHGAILPNLQWFDLKFKDDDVQNNNDAADWLADCAKRCFHSIDASNFSLEADELLLDMTGFGHGFMVSESGGSDEDELKFSMVPLKEAYFEEGDEMPRTFFRELNWKPSKIVDKFGIDNVPKIVKDRYENPQSNDKMTIIFAIFHREDKKDADTSLPLAPTERPFGHVYFLLESGEQVGDEGGYYEMPVYSVPWRTVSDSQWGHGPGHVSLGDIRQLNQHRLMRTRAIEKAIDPANVTTERGLMSNLDLGPGGLTVVREIGALQPYEGRANFVVSNEELALLQNSIKQAFYVDQLQLKESPAMTATEVQVRYELMNRLLGPTLGRMKVDWLNRVVENVFNIELRAGRLQERPEYLEQEGINNDVVIEYVGALATAQKAQLSQEVIQWAGQLAELSEPYPDLKYIVNAEELGRESARLRNIPEKIVNGADVVKEAKAADQKQQQQLMAAQQAQAQGEAMQAEGQGVQAMQQAEMGPEGIQ